MKDYQYDIMGNRTNVINTSSTLSISNPIADNGISIYPNPTSAIVHITSKKGSQIKSVIIYSVEGRAYKTGY